MCKREFFGEKSKAKTDVIIKSIFLNNLAIDKRLWHQCNKNEERMSGLEWNGRKKQRK